MRSGTELSHFLRIFLPTLVYSRTTTIIQNYNRGLIFIFIRQGQIWENARTQGFMDSFENFYQKR